MAISKIHDCARIAYDACIFLFFCWAIVTLNMYCWSECGWLSPHFCHNLTLHDCLLYHVYYDILSASSNVRPWISTWVSACPIFRKNERNEVGEFNVEIYADWFQSKHRHGNSRIDTFPYASLNTVISDEHLAESISNIKKISLPDMTIAWSAIYL